MPAVMPVVTADRLVVADALPLAADLAAVVGSSGLSRGQWVVCSGPGALTLGVAMLAPAVAQGAWAGLVGLPPLGADALGELGLSLDRVIAVDADPHTPREWAERLAVCSEGCEVMMTSVPAGMSESLWRSLSRRVHRNGAVVVAVAGRVGAAGPLSSVDLRCRVLEERWEGLGQGQGYLATRCLHVEAVVRRRPGVRRGWIRRGRMAIGAEDVC